MLVRSSLHQRLRTELRDLIELVLVPGLAAVLPWKLCFWVFKRMARITWLYRHACLQALAHASALGQVRINNSQWLATRRLVTLVDHADHYLARSRSNKFMERHMEVQGHWPDPAKAGICVTFHWGAGMWALRHVGLHGLHAQALVAATEGNPFAGRYVLQRYVMARTRSVGKALGRPPLVVTRSLRPVVQALRCNEQIFAAVDVPADQASASVGVRLSGMQAKVPKGLLRLAVDMKVPVTVYVTGFHLETGKRLLKIVTLEPSANSDAEALAHIIFRHLDEALAHDNAFWHFWSEAPRFFNN